MSLSRPIVLLTLLIALQLLFWLQPGIDLWISGLYFQPGHGFIYRDSLLPMFSYRLFRDLPFLVVPALLWLTFASWYWGGKAEAPVRRKLLFLLLTLALGPGLLVNGVFKSESGRARPFTVEQFGGERQFTPAFVPSDQCRKNCSFVSGHASMGFWFLAFAWVLRDRRWLYWGSAIGFAVGMGRVVQGAHFFSDVLFCLPPVLLSAMLCGRWLLGRWLPESPERG
jgi:lipid A 4'-phosphatase